MSSCVFVWLFCVLSQVSENVVGQTYVEMGF